MLINFSLIFQMTNPWNIKSIYDLQYFVCPSCIFMDPSKQNIIYHAYEFHPESIDNLDNINDDSLSGVIIPWKMVEIKKEQSEVKEEIDYNNDKNNYCNDKYGVDPTMVEVCLKFENTEQSDFNKETKNSTKIKKSSEVNTNVSCEYCNKEFSKSRNLKRHIASLHEGVKNFKCELCSKAFSRPDILRCGP